MEMGKYKHDPTITEEEIILANKALNWTDLGHDNLDRLMRLYLKKLSSQIKEQSGPLEPAATLNYV